MTKPDPATCALAPRPESAHPAAPWSATWRWVLVLVVAVTAARIVYLAWLCPYALIEDEAYYWQWSRHLDWSYYSKGPGVALVIAASTALFGDGEFGIRLPAALLTGVAAVAVAGLARDATGDRRAGFFGAAAFLCAPAFLVSGMLMTIDAPYVACWALACWAGYHGIERGRRAALLGAAGAVAAGFLFKYTIVLLIPGLVAHAALRRRRPGRVLLVLALGLALGAVPVLIWNSGHGWPTVRHLLGHLGAPGGDMRSEDAAPYTPLWTLEFIGMQIALIGPALGLGAVGAVRALRDPAAPVQRAGVAYLLACAAPIIAFYLAVTFFTDGEGNWAVAGYVSVLALAGWAVPGALDRTGALRNAWDRASGALWNATVAVGVIVAAAGARIDLAARIPVIGPRIPVGRLMSARPVAAETAERFRILAEETGQEPFYIAEHYGRAALLSYYIPGHPTVYCSSARMAIDGRETDYDYWAETDLDDLELLGGRPAVLVGRTWSGWELAFESVGSPVIPEHEHKGDRYVMFGYEYRGFPPRDGRTP